MRQLFLIAVTWGAIPIFFIDPFYGILHYTMINIIRPDQLLPWAPVGRIFFAEQIACFVSWSVNRAKLTPEYTPISFQVKILWLLAFEMTLVTFTVAFNPDYSWYWTLNFIKMTIFCFVMSKAINTTKKLERYYVITILWFTLLLIWGIQQKFLGNVLMEKINSLMPDRNGLAAVAVLYLPMAYYSIFSRKKWIKFFIGIPSTLILIIFIIYTDSRGGFLGMTVCMGILFLRSKGTQKIKTLIALVLLGVVFFQVAPPEYYERLATIMGEESEETGETKHESSAASRIAMWKGAIAVYKNNSQYWLLGVGMYCYAQMYINHIDEIAAVLDSDEFPLVFLSGGTGGKEIHNTYLSVLLGGGAVVFVTWMFTILYTWVQVHNIPRKYPRIVDGVDIHNYARGIEVGIIGYCVCVIFINSEFTDFFYWQLTMAGVLANLAKAKLTREALGLEDEELEEESIKRPAYVS